MKSPFSDFNFSLSMSTEANKLALWFVFRDKSTPYKDLAKK